MTLRDRIIEESTKEFQNKVDKLILKEETKMKATSTENFHDVIAIDFELQTFPNPDVQDKFIVSATNRDDIFCFVFEGPYIADACRKAGLFTSWEKDRKIRELGKENKNLNKCINALKSDLDLTKAANEAQRKFIKEYAGNDTEVTFNYAIGSGPITYGLYDKDYIDKLRKEIHDLIAENTELKTKLHDTAKEGDYIMYNGSPYTPSDIERLLTGIRQLEELKTHAIENFTDEEPSSRADILDCAKKCVCGQREQDYGTPESNFQLIADLWNGYLGFMDHPQDQIKAKDVAMLMALMKIARIRNGGGSGDSFVDLAGYAACGGEIWASNKETNGDSSQDTN